MNTRIEDIKGWRGAEWGMTNDHLLSLFKDEITFLEEPEDKGRNRFCELCIKNLKIPDGIKTKSGVNKVYTI